MALTFRVVSADSATGATYTTPPFSIGTASADRWVIALVSVSYQDATTLSLEIAGVAATQVGIEQLSDGVSFRAYAANVPTGTTATLAFVGNGANSFYDCDYAVWTEDAGEPTFFDEGFSNIPVSNTWSTTLDIPAGGETVAVSKDNFSSNTATWTGLTEDAEAGNRMWTAASDSSMSVETGRSVSVEASGGPVNFQDGLYVVSFSAPAPVGGVTVSLDAGSYSLTGNNLTATTDTAVSLDAGSYEFSGNDVAVDMNTAVPLDAGIFTFAGNDLAADFNTAVALDAGSYAQTGNDINVTVGAVVAISLDAGSYTFTGNDLATTLALSIPLARGAYVLTGNEIAIAEGISVPLDAGSYTQTGQDFAVTRNTAIPLDVGVYTQTGADINVTLDLVLSLDAGSYTFAGRDIVFSEGTLSARRVASIVGGGSNKAISATAPNAAGAILSGANRATMT